MERMNSWDSSDKKNSLIPSRHISHQIDDNDDDAAESENESVSEAGDIGDRVFHRTRSCESESGNLHFSSGCILENGVVISMPGDQKLQPCLSAAQSVTPGSNNREVGSTDIKERDKELPKILDYVSCMIHLAAFGILGVLTRYLLQKLFGPGVAGVTSDQTILYLDLPSNMVGSFLMGWLGVVFKGDISRVSEHLAIALTTGYLGSLTTFSGWNQKMLELTVAGHWLFSVLGFIIGLFLVAFSIIFGVETARGFKWVLSELKISSSGSGSSMNRKVDSYMRQIGVIVVFLVMLGSLWGASGALVRSEFKKHDRAAELWLGCMVGPLGVWVRWFLARLNGRGIGSSGLFKWIPFGTLIANVSAASLMAALAILKKSVNSWNCDTIVTGIQFGLLGCLSTVSTFASEFNAMRESMHPWRAYAYAIITIGLSFCFGILIYCLPVWLM